MSPHERFASASVGAVAAAVFLVEFLPSFATFGAPYGYFLDELYYLACAKRLAFGYVDHPPLAPWTLRLVTALLGESLPALRFLPAGLGAATVALTGWMAYRLGGGRFAQLLAALCLAVAPVPLYLFAVFSMNCFELFLWTLACWIVLELSVTDDPRWWLPLGAVIGIAFEFKHTSLLLAAGVAAGTLLTPLRTHLRVRWPWLGALTAAAIMLPNLWWQFAHDFVSLEFYRNLAAESNIPTTRIAVALTQIAIHPASLPVWAAGLVFFFSARGRPYRALGWLFATLFAAFVYAGVSRPDRIQGAYPVLFAGGGVLLEAVAVGRWRWIRYASVGLLLGLASLLGPLLVPVPPDLMAKHPLAAGTNDSRREVGPADIPILFSHRLGSEAFVAAVGDVYAGLPPEERSRAIVLAGDFAHAGAIELFGPAYGLPRVFSPHNNYYLWPPEPELVGDPVIAVALDVELLRREFRTVERAEQYSCAHCMGWRDALPIYVARGPRRPLRALWPELRRIGLPTRKWSMLQAESAVRTRAP